jgi:aminopeptidase M17-like protein
VAACDFLTGDGGESVPITPLGKQDLDPFLESFAAIASWVRATGFAADPGTHCVVPAAHGGIGRVLLGVGDEPMWDWATLPDKLPATVYHIDAAPSSVGRGGCCFRLDARHLPLRAVPKTARKPRHPALAGRRRPGCRPKRR